MSIMDWVNRTFSPRSTPGGGSRTVSSVSVNQRNNNQVAGAKLGYDDRRPAPTTTQEGFGYKRNQRPTREQHFWKLLPAANRPSSEHVEEYSNAFPHESLYGSSGAPRSSSPSSSQSSSTGGGSYYGGGGSYGGGSQLAPPPPMPAFSASAPTFDRYSGREWNPDDPGNVTPTDFSQRPAPYVREPRYKKLLGEEV